MNPEFVMEARRNPRFRAVLAQADLCWPTGLGCCGRRGGRAAPARAGHRLRRRAADRQRARPSRAGGSICSARRPAWPSVRPRSCRRVTRACEIVGAYAGSPADADAPDILARIRQARPDILFVAYGTPRQDLWIAAHRDGAGRARDDGRRRHVRLHCRRADGARPAGCSG